MCESCCVLSLSVLGHTVQVLKMILVSVKRLYSMVLMPTISRNILPGPVEVVEAPGHLLVPHRYRYTRGDKEFTHIHTHSLSLSQPPAVLANLAAAYQKALTQFTTKLAQQDPSKVSIVTMVTTHTHTHIHTDSTNGPKDIFTSCGRVFVQDTRHKIKPSLMELVSSARIINNMYKIGMSPLP